MTASIWTLYSERRPTKEDADAQGLLVAADSCGKITLCHWSMLGLDAWARIADVLTATGYVKPRKLHSAWRGLRSDSWENRRMVYVLGKEACEHRIGGPFYYSTAIAIGNYWTHWQPCDPPPVWEDE